MDKCNGRSKQLQYLEKSIEKSMEPIELNKIVWANTVNRVKKCVESGRPTPSYLSFGLGQVSLEHETHKIDTILKVKKYLRQTPFSHAPHCLANG